MANPQPPLTGLFEVDTTRVSPTGRPLGMVRRDDPPTSVAAADAVATHLTALHQQVIAAFERCGPMTDEALERLPEFADYGPSTIRKRRSELYARGTLEVAGESKNSRGRTMLVFDLTAGK